jgi:hypothetical protein
MQNTMAAHLVRRHFFVLLLGMVHFQAKPVKPQKAETKPTCIESWHVERDDNPWSGLTSTAEAEVRTYRVRSAALNGAEKNLIKAIEGLVPANEIILLRAPDSVEVTVNKKYFGDLTRQDATRGAFTQGGLIGNATPHSLKIFTSRQILALLLQYQVILTYAHIEADICLIREQTQNGLYSAALTGEHTFYTNSRNVSSFGFEFVLNEKTGEMRVAQP